MAELVNVSASIPQDRVAEFYEFVAELVAESTSKGTNGVASTGGVRARSGFGRDTVRKNYLGGVSDHWRPFLQVLASNPGEWWAWSDLCQEIGMTPREASGMLGAAERRCKQKPPYEKVQEGGEHWFLMPQEVADVVLELAAKDK